MGKLNYEVKNIEGISQIKIDVPYAVKFVCLYLFELDGLNILIDTGLNIGTWKNKLFSALKDINLSIQDIDYCIITHMHTDHIGNCLNLKQKNPELKLLMHDITHELLKWETNDENLKELKQEAREVAKQLKKYGLSEVQGKKLFSFLHIGPNSYSIKNRILYARWRHNIG